MNRKRGTSTSSTYVTMTYNKHVRFPELQKEESEMPNECTHNRPNEKIRTYPNERKYLEAVIVETGNGKLTE